MARRSQFSEEERAAAVGRAFDGGSTPAAVAAELGVNPTTLYRWAQADDRRGRAPSASGTADRLVVAAAELLRTRGYGEITVQDVAAHAGVALRTAFNAFASKQELFHAVVDDVAQGLSDAMDDGLPDDARPGDPVAHLREALLVAARVALEDDRSHVLFCDLGVPREDRFDEPWHRLFSESLREILEEVERRGALRPGLEPAGAADLLARAMRGIYAAVLDGGSTEQALVVVGHLHQTVADDAALSRPRRRSARAR